MAGLRSENSIGASLVPDKTARPLVMDMVQIQTTRGPRVWIGFFG